MNICFTGPLYARYTVKKKWKTGYFLLKICIAEPESQIK
jgi:hypothetical protein